MQSIKFMSLIVICATSCLALLLPAIGVVPFPKQLSGVHNHDAHGLGTDGQLPGGSMPVSDPWGLGGTNPGAPQPNMAGGSMAGLPISTSGMQNISSSPTLAGTGAQIAGNYSDPSRGDVLPTDAGSANAGSANAGLSKYDTVGFGIWLLLVPVWLIGLVVWSITPSPKSRSK